MSDGGCECGAIRYRLAAAPFFVNCCHCRQCQKITGSAFAINAMIERDRIVLTRGEPVVAEGGTARCPECAALLWATHRMFGDKIVFLRAGTLDESETLTPDAHFFVRSKHRWITLPEDARSFETLPGADDVLMTGAARQRLDAALAR